MRIAVDCIGARALPVVIAPFVAVLTRCVWGALTGAVVNEVITLVPHGKQADAQSRVYALVGAVLWVIVQLGPKR